MTPASSTFFPPMGQYGSPAGVHQPHKEMSVSVMFALCPFHHEGIGDEKISAVGGKRAALLGLPIYEAAFMNQGAPAPLPAEHTAVCSRGSACIRPILARCPLTPPTPLIHTTNSHFCLSHLPFVSTVPLIFSGSQSLICLCPSLECFCTGLTLQKQEFKRASRPCVKIFQSSLMQEK